LPQTLLGFPFLFKGRHMLQDKLTIAGKLSLVLTDQNGNIKQVVEKPNLVVNTGLAFITGRMLNAASSVMSHMGLGTGATAAAAGNTDLGAALGARQALTSSTQSGANNQSAVYVASFGAGVATGAITEAGIFNALTAGTMLCRTVFGVVNKGAQDTLTLTWTITLSAS
jgi:hypothetical protein